MSQQKSVHCCVVATKFCKTKIPSLGIDQGIHTVKLLKMKHEKKLCGFSFSINMTNFEAFRRTKRLISNLFFLKSGITNPGN